MLDLSNVKLSVSMSTMVCATLALNLELMQLAGRVTP